MTVMTRRENQGLVIDNDIHVTILKIEEDQVRIAVSNPHQEPHYQEYVLQCRQADAWSFRHSRDLNDPATEAL